jgi:hypothetical protein
VHPYAEVTLTTNSVLAEMNSFGPAESVRGLTPLSFGYEPSYCLGAVLARDAGTRYR